QPFNRSPQWWLNYGARLKWTAAAVYQRMATSTGPDGKTYLYQHNAVAPDLFASVDYSEHRFLTGWAVDYKSILPEQYITDGNGVKIVNKRKLNTPAFMVYGKYTGKSLIVSAKALYGQNLTDHNLIGGYAITPDHNYIPYNTFTSFINLTYGVKHQFDLFAGYSANLGPDKTLPENSNFYGFGVDEANTSEEKMIGTMYRLTPSYSYNLPHWKIGVELEYTNAAWGKRAAEGSIIDLDRSDNQRVYAKLMYKF
ncbi:MAG: hypothetical protein Q8914_08815, partial [Bacteroidota bacterium]|nr:hypothetical protein [Bacteroidota bacterium]